MTSTHYDTAGTAGPMCHGTAFGHIASRLRAETSAALIDVVELTALGRLRVLVDRCVMCDAQEAYDDRQHERIVARAVLICAHSEPRAGDHAPPTHHACSDGCRVCSPVSRRVHGIETFDVLRGGSTCSCRVSPH